MNPLTVALLLVVGVIFVTWSLCLWAGRKGWGPAPILPASYFVR